MCKFCSTFHFAQAPCDRAVHETANFIVVPTIGALVPGWVLVVSKEHRISAGALPQQTLLELRETVGRVAGMMRRSHTSVAVFEHGPICDKTSVGCGIDHCHIHVAPLGFDLWSAAGSLSLEHQISWRAVSDISATKLLYEVGKPYLYVEQDGSSRIGTSRSLPSQFFRRVIASHQGRPHAFDWRTHDVVPPEHLVEADRLRQLMS